MLRTDKLDKNEKWSSNVWAYASIDDVKTNFSNFGLLSTNVKFVEGDVLQTLDQTIPDKISVLRLDTDWYESTKKEMETLYKKIVPHGVIMIDDYGHWGGSKKAVDEYFNENNNRPFLQYIDYTGRLGIKTL
jgi:predicted O-methyltransferase YrrM